MWQRKELIVNKNYQRSASVWPEAARTYLVDTILNGYVVPKVYFYQVFDKSRKKVIREIVDGQQRLTTILSYLENEFPLTSRSTKFEGKKFEDLDDEQQQAYLTYPIEVDIIYSAEQSDLLAMFTRMNAYTAPLNPAEKRHAQFEGPFKWFILEANATIGPRLVELGVITSKQSIRMQDAEFLTELAIVLENGITNKSEKGLSDIYKKYDKEFSRESEYRKKIGEFVDLLDGDFLPLRDTFLMKAYVCHSLFCALMHKKYGIPGGDQLQIETDGVFYTDLQATLDNLSKLAEAHELHSIDGKYAEYVEACLSTTHRIKQRQTRSKWLGNALT
jgi:mRNA-degrading endonuclease YafQ of YafQ-DinJ toxin-antitoxin module